MSNLRLKRLTIVIISLKRENGNPRNRFLLLPLWIELLNVSLIFSLLLTYSHLLYKLKEYRHTPYIIMSHLQPICCVW